MEYIHKAKAEKSRTKILSDQMEARRIKNKVQSPIPHNPIEYSLVLMNVVSALHCRRFGSAVLRVLRRREKLFLRWSMKGPKHEILQVSCLIPRIRIILRHAMLQTCQHECTPGHCHACMYLCVYYEGLVVNEGVWRLSLFVNPS